jgi:hypothetical protein
MNRKKRKKKEERKEGTHEIDADRANVALSVRVILEERDNMVSRHGFLRRNDDAVPTAKRSSRQDLPTPESPISSSLNR